MLRKQSLFTVRTTQNPQIKNTALDIGKIAGTCNYQ
jgi:hypothetical protein